MAAGLVTAYLQLCLAVGVVGVPADRGKRPLSVKSGERYLGIYDILSQSTTPFLWHGQLLLAEERSDRPGDKRIHIGGEPLFNGTSHFRIRQQSLLGVGSNGVVLSLVPGTLGLSFCSAHVAAQPDGNMTLYVYGTNNDHRYGGAPRSQVHVLWSSDPSLRTWERAVALTLPPGYAAFKAAVTRGPDGGYMAIELNAPPAIAGASFASIFAKSASAADLSTGWALLDPRLHVFTKARYSANPVLRYFPADGYFYLITLFSDVPNRTRAGEARDAPCCYVEWLVRSKDLKAFEEAAANPLLGWPDWSDRVIMPGSLLQQLGSQEQKTLGTHPTWSDIDRSDMDMAELPQEFVAKLDGAPPGAGPWTWVNFEASNQVRCGCVCVCVCVCVSHFRLSHSFLRT